MSYSLNVVLDTLISFGARLGGSRYMNKKYGEAIPITKYTDYDVFIQHGGIDKALISKLGFINKNIPPQYCDTDVVCLYVHQTLQMQLIERRDADMYAEALNTIPCEFYRMYLWKSNPECVRHDGCFKQHVRAYFNGLFEVVKSKIETEKTKWPAQ